MDATAIVVAVLGSSAVTGVITGILSRRRNAAEATRIITEAAATLVKTLTEDNARKAAEIVALDSRVEKLERQAGADRKAQQLHVGWDMLARERLKEHGVVLPEPPPLYAPEVA